MCYLYGNLFSFKLIVEYVNSCHFFSYFDKRKIINIRLIASERNFKMTQKSIQQGLVYVSEF